ncbi:MAG: hypothetical protein AAGA81_11480 [Acidobacteriota bacterium]
MVEAGFLEALLVVAMHEEARPLSRHLRLSADDSARGFRCFRKDGTHLIVSGPGRERAGLATAYGAARLARPERAVFLNVGVAGSGLDPVAYPLGSVFLAHSISERLSGRRFFPSLAFAPPVPTAGVVTCDEVETEYRDAVLFEMEASGFYSAARRFGTAELIHSLKVVSDHAESPVGELDAASITAYVEGALSPTQKILDELSRQALELDDSPAEALVSRWLVSHRLSKTLQRRLRTVARRLLALGVDDCPPELSTEAENGRAFVAKLESYVDELSVQALESRNAQRQDAGAPR